MDDRTGSESPLDAVARTVGEESVEAFELLGNGTRLAILLAIWDAKDPRHHALSEGPHSSLSFSDLRNRVGMRDSGKFNYHLDKLRGTFVKQTDEGYALTTPAEQVLRTIMAGTLAEQPSFEGIPIDTDCWLCGSTVVVDYDDGILTMRCTNCAGPVRSPETPSGTIVRLYRPPVGLENRTPREFHRHGNVWSRHRRLSMLEGACPDCSGAVTPTLHVCDNHDPVAGTACEACGWRYRTKWTFVCDVCKNTFSIRGVGPVFTDVAVLAFFHDHGLDAYELRDTDAWGVIDDAIGDVEVTGRDPAEVRVTIELEGDRLRVTLDDRARVVDATEVTG